MLSKMTLGRTEDFNVMWELSLPMNSFSGEALWSSPTPCRFILMGAAFLQMWDLSLFYFSSLAFAFLMLASRGRKPFKKALGRAPAKLEVICLQKGSKKNRDKEFPPRSCVFRPFSMMTSPAPKRDHCCRDQSDGLGERRWTWAPDWVRASWKASGMMQSSGALRQVGSFQWLVPGAGSQARSPGRCREVLMVLMQKLCSYSVQYIRSFLAKCLRKERALPHASFRGGGNPAQSEHPGALTISLSDGEMSHRTAGIKARTGWFWGQHIHCHLLKRPNSWEMLSICFTKQVFLYVSKETGKVRTGRNIILMSRDDIASQLKKMEFKRVQR